MNGPEHTGVEQPFIDQLVAMGWKHTTGNKDHASATGRASFREVLLLEELRKALVRINREPAGEAWLGAGRLDKAVQDLQRLPAANLLAANREATRLITAGTTVEGVPGWEDGRSRPVHYIDWQNPENNTFRVINQFQVKCPEGQPKRFSDPDLVLFVNGIPLVVVECKRRAENRGAQLGAAIDQLQRYANRRKALGTVEWNEGVERLFHFNQFLVATCFDEARVGTISSSACDYLQWRDTSPVPMADVAAALGREELSSQELLVAGMLRPAHLLDIVRHFTLFLEKGGRTVKAVCRYQQFRAVQLSIRRLLHGKTRAQHGEIDRRGGIIWHTQGSGKSLTMVFLIRKMRSNPALRGFKIVVVTDRKSLEKQLAATATLVGEPLHVVKPQRRGERTISSWEVLQEALRKAGKDLVFGMIQKFRGQRGKPDPDTDEEDEAGLDDEIAIAAPSEPLPVLNESEKILVLVDEAHRSHGSALHAHLLHGLPNCARIGFTGTPILMGAKKRTHEIFGDFIDRYTIRQSERDGSTVRILYEGRTTRSIVEGGGSLDQKFEDMLHDWTPEERDRIKNKYGTKGHVMEARALIAAKARDMLRHYVANVLPNGFKAQIVAVSRRATVRYYEELVKARDELVVELEALDASRLELPDDEVQDLEPKEAFLVHAHAYLSMIRRLEFAPVISAAHNDTVDPQGEWSARGKIDARIARFKRPLFDPDESRADPLAFLIVKSMLLTGFDAPVEQVLYLDRHIQQAELLQAVARVNRTYARGEVEKTHGIVIDYYGVARHLSDALAVYSPEDANELRASFVSLKDELPKLRDQHQRVLDLFTRHKDGVRDLGRLSAWERRQLIREFRRWLHRNIQDSQRAALLGDGTEAAAARVLDALERLLLAPTPGEGPDPYRHMHEHAIVGIKGVLSAAAAGGAHGTVPLTNLLAQIEACVFKLLALYEPETYRMLRGKGLADGILWGLMPRGRSRYTLGLTKKEFEDEAGWAERTSYENAVYDTIKSRNHAMHGQTGLIEDHVWESAIAMLLGLIDHNLPDLATLPERTEPRIDNVERCVRLLGHDERLRAEFHVKLKRFLQTLDSVLPRPEALPYVDDAKLLAHIQAKARNRYRGGERLIGREVGEKVRKLIDEHIASQGIDPRIAPVEITDKSFAQRVEAERSQEAKASEMEHALRHHIRQHFDEDPIQYEQLSQRLEGILETLKDQWEKQAEQLWSLIEEAKEGRKADGTGLEPQTQAPFYDVLCKAATGPLTSAHRMRVIELTVDIVDHIRQELAIEDFWTKRTQAQAGLRKWIHQRLDRPDLDEIFDYDQLEAISLGLMQLAKAKSHRLAT